MGEENNSRYERCSADNEKERIISTIAPHKVRRFNNDGVELCYVDFYWFSFVPRQWHCSFPRPKRRLNKPTDGNGQERITRRIGNGITIIPTCITPTIIIRRNISEVPKTFITATRRKCRFRRTTRIGSISIRCRSGTIKGFTTGSTFFKTKYLLVV